LTVIGEIELFLNSTKKPAAALKKLCGWSSDPEGMVKLDEILSESDAIGFFISHIGRTERRWWNWMKYGVRSGLWECFHITYPYWKRYELFIDLTSAFSEKCSAVMKYPGIFIFLSVLRFILNGRN
jgi:hypothetical protein